MTDISLWNIRACLTGFGYIYKQLIIHNLWATKIILRLPALRCCLYTVMSNEFYVPLPAIRKTAIKKIIHKPLTYQLERLVRLFAPKIGYGLGQIKSNPLVLLCNQIEGEIFSLKSMTENTGNPEPCWFDKQWNENDSWDKKWGRMKIILGSIYDGKLCNINPWFDRKSNKTRTKIIHVLEFTWEGIVIGFDWVENWDNAGCRRAASSG